MMVEASIPVNTDRVSHSWKGDWNHFNNGATGAVYYTEDSHYVWIPNGTTQMEARFVPTEFDLDTAQGGALQLEIDLGEDGSNDAQGACTRVSELGFATSMLNHRTGIHGHISMSPVKHSRS